MARVHLQWLGLMTHIGSRELIESIYQKSLQLTK